MIRSILGAVLILVVPAGFAQQSLEVISLRHRTAEQVLDTLQPLVEPGGTLTGRGNQLIVRVSPDNLAEIRRALDAIDRPQRRLQISVRFDSAGQASRRDLGASGVISNQGVRVEAHGRDARADLSEQVDQRVQVVEGGRATLFTGEETVRGFEVIPRISGNMVSMQIASSLTASTVSGRLGEWFELGAIERSAARDERSIGSVRESASTGSRRVWVKVDPLD
jgi:hypothetical protein